MGLEVLNNLILADPYFSTILNIQDSGGVNATSYLSIFGHIVCNSGRYLKTIGYAICGDPVAYDVSVRLPENSFAAFLLNSTNFISSTLVNTIVSLPAHGIISTSSVNTVGKTGLIVGSQIQPYSYVYYTPNTNFYGLDTFLYSGNGSASATVYLTTAFVNQPPSFLNLSKNIAIFSNTSRYTINLNSLVTDVDEFQGFAFTFNVLTKLGVWSINGTTPFTFSPFQSLISANNILTLDLNGQGAQGNYAYFSFYVTVTDSYGNSGKNSMLIQGLITCLSGETIASDNINLCRGPKVYNSSFTCAENQASVLVTLNSAPVGTNSLPLTIARIPTYGKLFQYNSGLLGNAVSANYTSVFSASGLLFYQPKLNFYGVDTFEFFGMDAIISNQATVSIIVSFVNQPPVFAPVTYTFAINDNSGTYSLDLSTVLSDPDETNFLELDFLTMPGKGMWARSLSLVDPNGNSVVALSNDPNGTFSPVILFSRDLHTSLVVSVNNSAGGGNTYLN